MVYRVVATKLTEEEHTKLLDACNKEGCTPSNLIKDAIMKRLNPEEKPQEKKLTLEDLLKGLKNQEASSSERKVRVSMNDLSQ
jgi:hypothetical protein